LPLIHRAHPDQFSPFSQVSPNFFHFNPFVVYYSFAGGVFSPMLLKLFKELHWFENFLVITALLLTLLGVIGAGSMKGVKEEIQVTGRVYVMGNEPFTQVAIQLDDGKIYALTGEYDKQLRSLQGKRLSVVGIPGGKTPRGAEAIEVKSFQILEPK
jgi:hypothetical protein